MIVYYIYITKNFNKISIPIVVTLGITSKMKYFKYLKGNKLNVFNVLQ